MNITISKQDFEQALPVGKAASDNVFAAVSPAIEAQLDFAADALLGTEGMALIDERGEGSQLLLWYKRTVALSALLSVLRQLDLVLTPTGFGVVSNDNLAPASKQRVDALEASLRTQYHRSLAMAVNQLRSDAWGQTAQARFFIGHVYDEWTFFYQTHQGASSTDWHEYQPTIEQADEMLRTKMGDAQMNDILDAMRRADTERTDQYREVVSLIVKFTDTWAQKGVATLRQPVFGRLMRTIDSDDNAETFALYRSSASYKANHYEPYKNRKDTAAFIFNG